MTDATLNHYIQRWTYWTSRCDSLDGEYNRRLEAFRTTHPQMDEVTQGVEFDKSFTGRSLEAAKIWAHRRVVTYSQIILVLRELQQEPEIVPVFPHTLRPRRG